MKSMKNSLKRMSVAVLLASPILARAGTFSSNFDDAQVPTGSAIFGNAVVEPAGGVNNSGVLKLTKAANGQQSAFIIEDVDAGAPVYGVSVNFKARVGGGTSTPADGFSFSWATDLPDGAFSEEGTGTGLTVAFDIYDNGGGEAPAIDVKYAGVTLASTKFTIASIATGASFENVAINLKANGTLDVVYNGIILYHDFPVNGFASITGGRFGFAARTGGSSENQWIDDLALSTVTVPGPLRITQQPASAVALIGKFATFTVNVNDPTGVAFQWFKNGTAIPGANALIYTTPALTGADDQTKYKVTATAPNGASVTSDEVTLGVLDLQAPTIPKLAFNFNNGQVPPNTAVYGTALVDAAGGVGGSGVLKLTVAENNQNGSFVVQPIEGGAQVSGLTAAFSVLVGGGTPTPADGFSFNFAPNFPNGTIGGAEDGAGTGLTVAFDIYDNAGGEGPSIDIKFKGIVVASTKLPRPFLETGDVATPESPGNFVPVLIRLNPNGTLDLAYKDQVIYNKFPITNYATISNGKFAWAARTGGLNENQWIDDIAITTVKATGPLRILQEPQSVVVLAGKTATFNVTVSDPAGATYQWLKNGAAIASATAASYTTPALTEADSGGNYSVQVTSPNGNATSAQASVTVVAAITAVSPKVNFTFDDSQAPAGATVLGTAFVDATGGVNNTGVLKLTVAENGQLGTFLIDDLDNGKAVSGFTATFKARVGGGTSTPADGFSFVWANDLDPASGFGEDGAGSGLTVSFDIYDNGGGEAPAMDVRFGGQDVASKKVPITKIETGDNFVDVAIRVESDGTFDLVYNGEVIYYNLPLPNFTPMANGVFAFGARTGGLNENQWIDNLAISTSTGGVAPKFTSIRKVQANVVIEWSGGGSVQSAPDIIGPWTTIPAASPLTVTPTGPRSFYRIAP